MTQGGRERTARRQDARVLYTPSTYGAQLEPPSFLSSLLISPHLVLLDSSDLDGEREGAAAPAAHPRPPTHQRGPSTLRILFTFYDITIRFLGLSPVCRSDAPPPLLVPALSWSLLRASSFLFLFFVLVSRFCPFETSGASSLPPCLVLTPLPFPLPSSRCRISSSFAFQRLTRPLPPRTCSPLTAGPASEPRFPQEAQESGEGEGGGW